MDWNNILWVSTQISIIALFSTATIMTIVFIWLGIVGISAISQAKKYFQYKAIQFEEMQESVKKGFSENLAKAGSIAPFAGLFMSILGLKKNKSIFERIVEKLKK